MGRRSHHGDDFNAWPAVADMFLGILGVTLACLVPALWFVNHQGHRESPSFHEFVRRVRGLENAPGSLLLPRAEVLSDDQVRKFSELRLVMTAEALSFDPCMHLLPPDKKAKIRELVAEVIEPFAPEIEFWRIEGHADANVAAACPHLEPFRDNLQLSQNRAHAVFEAARTQANDVMNPVVEKLWNAGKIQVAGFADTMLLDKKDPLAPINRRVEFRVKFREMR